ncbi:MAG: exodeoxyribonuclease VII large subunit, partial [Gemmatimonadota bacterium]|nr:exodeoxyribonuclease VII large subunit [Gemmatimonadota bacterium]
NTSAEPTATTQPTRIYSVTEARALHDANAQASLGPLWIEGEVSRINRDTRGHSYFRLRDERGEIRCVVFQSQAACIPPQLTDGVDARVWGSVGWYHHMHRQVDVRQMHILPEDDRAEADTPLEPERDVLVSRRRPIPAYARCVAVVTAASGDVIHDILQVVNGRDPWMQLKLVPAQTQGAGAPESIAAAIRHAGLSGAEAIIVARGGGSRSDLQAFDSDEVVAAIRACDVPVVTGIGHAPDTTLADQVADLACATPTAAALALTPVPGKDLLRCVEEATARAEYAVRRTIAAADTQARESVQSVARLVGREEVPAEAADPDARLASPPDPHPRAGSTEPVPSRAAADGAAHPGAPIPAGADLHGAIHTPFPDVWLEFPPIETSLRRIEEIRATLERRRVPLEEALQLYEDARVHAAAVRWLIQGARRRVELENGG